MQSFEPDGILIDFYGTIAAGDRSAVLRTCRTVVETCRLKITPDAFAIRWGQRYFATVLASNQDVRTVPDCRFRTLHECEIVSLRETLEALAPQDARADGQRGVVGVCADLSGLVAELESYWADPPLHPDAVEFLRRVDRPICCVSNADTKPLMSAIKKHGLRFDAIVSSEAVRCYKPDAPIFEHALDRLGISADRAIHIGDSLHSDIAGAKSAGITAVWICRDDRIHDIGDTTPDCTISSFDGFMTNR